MSTPSPSKKSSFLSLITIITLFFVGILAIFIIGKFNKISGLSIGFDMALSFADSAIYSIFKPKYSPHLDEEACQKIGGVFKNSQCYASDGGKPCISGFQCSVGQCEASTFIEDITGSGTCKEQTFLHNGSNRFVHFGILETSWIIVN